ncbi:MAG: NADH-quinone oxidoreductase subunit NuoE [Bacillota bacterium]
MTCKCGHNDEGVKLEALQKAIDKYKTLKGGLIPLLQEAQEIYSYLPKEVMQQISRGLGIPFSKTFGVATFYAQFHLKPRGRNVIRICQGTACHVRGAAKLFDSVSENLGVGINGTTEDFRYTLETVACLGACGLAPAMMINDDTHGRLSPDNVTDILKQYE